MTAPFRSLRSKAKELSNLVRAVTNLPLCGICGGRHEPALRTTGPAMHRQVTAGPLFNFSSRNPTNMACPAKALLDALGCAGTYRSFASAHGCLRELLSATDTGVATSAFSRVLQGVNVDGAADTDTGAPSDPYDASQQGDLGHFLLSFGSSFPALSAAWTWKLRESFTCPKCGVTVSSCIDKSSFGRWEPPAGAVKISVIEAMRRVNCFDESAEERDRSSRICRMCKESVMVALRMAVEDAAPLLLVQRAQCDADPAGIKAMRIKNGAAASFTLSQVVQARGEPFI